MSKRRRKLEPPAPQPAASAASERGRAGPAKRVISPRRQPLLWRVVASVVIPIVFLGGCELALRICGYGYSTRFFVPVRGSNAWTTNPKFGCRFSPKKMATTPYPFIFQAQKQPGRKRIFILGESAAQGAPAPAFGFGRMLEVMAEQAYPDQPVEILNAAMRGINSHAILPIARECVQHEPDVFIIYMGNNEVVGLHAPSPRSLKWGKPLWLLRTGQSLKQTRLGQFISDTAALLRRSKQDMESFRKQRLAADDPRRERVCENFKTNLKEILEVTRASGARVILCTVAGNLVDFPPLGSLHRGDLPPAELARWDAIYQQGVTAENARQFQEAITNYLAAERLDDHFAELHFRLARSFLAQGEMAPARRHFELARDWDALQFRTDSRLNAIIRELGKEASAASPGWLMLLDLEEVFARKVFATNSAAGSPLFHDHVHFTFDGDYLLAQTIFPALRSALRKPAEGRAAAPVPSRQACAAALAFTEWDELNVAAVTVHMTTNPPFLDQLDHAARQSELERKIQEQQTLFQAQGKMGPALEVYRAALAKRPKDWQIHMNYGMLLALTGNNPAAAQEYRQAAALMPVFPSLRALLANTLWKLGDRDQARLELIEALKVDPDCRAAKDGLKKISN